MMTLGMMTLGTMIMAVVDDCAMQRECASERHSDGGARMHWRLGRHWWHAAILFAGGVKGGRSDRISVTALTLLV